MEFLLEQDKTHKGYPYYIELNDQISRGDQKEFLSRLTSQQTDFLNKYKGESFYNPFNTLKFF